MWCPVLLKALMVSSSAGRAVVIVSSGSSLVAAVAQFSSQAPICRACACTCSMVYRLGLASSSR